MSDEDAFLTALAEHPTDDVRRLVYADWLEEHDQPEKANYLRLVCRVVTVLGTTDEPAAIDAVLEASEGLPGSWRDTAAGRFGLELTGYTADRKIDTIRHLRQYFGWGLDEAKVQSERLPNRLMAAAPVEDVVCMLVRFQTSAGIDLAVTADVEGASRACRPLFQTDQLYHLRVCFNYMDPMNRGPMPEECEAVVREFVARHQSSDAADNFVLDNGGYQAPVAHVLPLSRIVKLLRQVRADGERVAQQHNGLRFFAFIHPAYQRRTR